MRGEPVGGASTLIRQVEEQVRRTTYGRIRDLTVEEVQGLVVVSGQVPSHHTKQLALHAALALVPSDRCHTNITVG